MKTIPPSTIKNKENTHLKPDRKKFLKAKTRNKSIVKSTKIPARVNEVSANWKEYLAKQKKDGNATTRQPNQNTKSNKLAIKTSNASNLKTKTLQKESKKRLITENHNDIWFDDVDPRLLENECGIKRKSVQNVKIPEENKVDIVKEDKEINLTRYVALDCEMVGIGLEGKENSLARVSLVNSLGDCIYDKFCKPKEKVVDYRTEVSGIRPEDLKNAPNYEIVQKEVADILKGRILVGHALQNDLKVLLLSHSRWLIRDTAKYKPFHKLLGTKRPALKKLAAEILSKQIQSGEHSSVVDARATMEIFQKYRKEWEYSLRVKGTEKKRSGKDKDIFMGKEQRMRKVNKWTKIKQRKKQKDL